MYKCPMGNIANPSTIVKNIQCTKAANLALLQQNEYNTLLPIILPFANKK